MFMIQKREREKELRDCQEDFSPNGRVIFIGDLKAKGEVLV